VSKVTAPQDRRRCQIKRTGKKLFYVKLQIPIGDVIKCGESWSLCWLKNTFCQYL